MADAIRDELREALLRKYGTLEAAAEASRVPYKTLYRALTARGKDRSQSVKLELVMDIAGHLASVGEESFADLFDNAQRNVARRRQDYDLVSNDSINEFPDGNDTDYDHA